MDGQSSDQNQAYKKLGMTRLVPGWTVSASISDWMIYVLIRLPVAASTLWSDLFLTLASSEMTIGGAKASVSPYLSETYMANSMNRA